MELMVLVCLHAGIRVKGQKRPFRVFFILSRRGAADLSVMAELTEQRYRVLDVVDRLANQLLDARDVLVALVRVTGKLRARAILQVLGSGIGSHGICFDISFFGNYKSIRHRDHFVNPLLEVTQQKRYRAGVMGRTNKKKPGRSPGNENHQSIPFTRAHSERVRLTTKQARTDAKFQARRLDGGFSVCPKSLRPSPLPAILQGAIGGCYLIGRLTESTPYDVSSAYFFVRISGTRSTYIKVRLTAFLDPASKSTRTDIVRKFVF
jgi:hypothetical protein